MSSTMAADTRMTQLLDAVDRLAPAIEAMRRRIERERRLPEELVGNLRAAGVFHLWLARSLGGPELSLTQFAQIIERLAQADGAVGWCVSVGAAFSRFSGFLCEPAARQIFVEDQAIIAGALAPNGTAVAVDGGFRVTGRWPFGSGIMHSEWTVGLSVILENDKPRRAPTGAPDMRVMFFPTSAAEIIDTWDVGGLRGTGSHDYQISDLFVPDAYATEGVEPVIPGPIYAFPRHTAYPVAIASVPLGIARAALETFKGLAETRTPQIGSTLLRDKLTTQAVVGRAEASLRAARAFLFEACDDAWATVAAGGTLTLHQRALVRLACAQVATSAKTVIQDLYETAGGAAVYEVNLLQRHLRDVQVTAQHFQVHCANFESGGRVMLGMDPETIHL
jgi:alkylation response protein AidB-like acyl-CoA dehydrogenase